jgi:hypothetical protein
MVVTVAFTEEAKWFSRFFYHLFQHHLPNFAIQKANPANPPNILFFSIFGPDYKQFLRNGRTRLVLVSGEPNDLSAYSFASLIIDCKNTPHLRPSNVPFVYLPFYVTSFGERFHHQPGDLMTKPKHDKTKFCAFVYSQEIDFRNSFFDALNQYKKVDALGKCRNNNNNVIDRHVYEYGKQTYNDLAVQKYFPYKFVIAMENSRHLGYVTEKIINPMLAGSVPIYFGAPDITQHFNPKSFIRIDDFSSYEEAVKYIEKVDKDDELYASYVREPWFTGSVFPFQTFQAKPVADHLLSILKPQGRQPPTPPSAPAITRQVGRPQQPRFSRRAVSRFPQQMMARQRGMNINQKRPLISYFFGKRHPVLNHSKGRINQWMIKQKGVPPKSTKRSYGQKKIGI